MRDELKYNVVIIHSPNTIGLYNAEQTSWLCANVGAYEVTWEVKWNGENIEYYFLIEEDAINFRLRF